MRRLRLALLLVLVAAPAAAAQAPAPPPASPPDERAAAREFSFAAYRLRLAVKANRAELIARARRYADPACRIDLSDLPERRAEQALEALVGVYLVVVLDTSLAPQLPAVRRLETELAAVPTRDRALRSGRAGWRTTRKLLEGIPAAPADLCAQIAGWRESGYRRARAPKVPTLDEAFIEKFGEEDETTDPKLQAAARRMRALGVGASAARRFVGHSIFADADIFPKEAERLLERFFGPEPDGGE